MSKMLIDRQLRELRPFQTCSRQQLRLASRNARSVTVAPGEVLMEQGDKGRSVMVIADGDAMVTKDGESVAVISRGDVVGEMSMLVNAPRTATVTARSPMTVLVFDNHAFASVLDASPQFASSVMRTAVKRLAV